MRLVSEEEIKYISKMRRYFHMYPECGMVEYNTSKTIKKELKNIGIPYSAIAGTGVIATIKGAMPGACVLLRADMDALAINEENEVEYKSKNDGIMHACGHDGHMSMLLGAAKVLNELKDSFCGEIKLLFQPGEEIALGAKMVLDEIDLKKDIDACFAIHLWQDVTVGKISIQSGARMAAADLFKVKIKGKSGHGSMPHQTIDSIVVGSAVVMNLQHLVSRGSDPLEPYVITVGKFNSGIKSNIIAGEALLEGTVRTFDEKIWINVYEDLKRVIYNTSAAYNAEAEIELIRATPALYNDKSIVDISVESAIKLYGMQSLVECKKTMGGEDFAYITKEIPGALAFVGTRNDKLGINEPHHNERFDIDEKSLEIGANLYIQFAIDYLEKRKIHKS